MRHFKDALRINPAESSIDRPTYIGFGGKHLLNSVTLLYY